jgi:plastocyanin
MLPTPSRTVLPVLLLAAGIFLARCGVPPRPGSETLPSPGEVWIQEEAFQPNIIRVDEGTRVTWLNRDGEVHTITDGLNRPEGRFESGDISPGGSFSHDFYEPGVYYYYSRYHPGVTRGVIIVGLEKRDNPF